MDDRKKEWKNNIKKRNDNLEILPQYFHNKVTKFHVSRQSTASLLLGAAHTEAEFIFSSNILGK